MHFHRQYFILTVLLIIIEVLIAKYMHDSFTRPFVGDFLVVILIYCFVRSFFEVHTMAVAIGVLLFAYVVEVSQYYNLVNVLGLAHSTTAKLILGTSFSWADMLMYTFEIITVIIAELLASSRQQIAG